MKKILRKIFFPFTADKYKFLENKRWHRLIKVCFIIFMTIIFIIFQRIQITSNENSYKECMASLGNNSKNIELCRSGNLSRLEMLSGTLSIMFFSFYLLQFIYFKGIIYIIYGNKKK